MSRRTHCGATTTRSFARRSSAAQGTVGKWLGDGVMAAFDSAAAAVECAAEMQQRITDYARRTELGVAIRVGLSAGDVAEEAGDWHGTPVVEAARLEAAAEGGQILAAEIVKQLAGSRTTLGFGPAGRCR